jgi:hypothetical protein
MGSFDSENRVTSTIDEDDAELVALGYQPSFKREFTNLATVRSLPTLSLDVAIDIFMALRLVLPSASW